MGSKKYGITFLVVGILIVSYLSFTFFAGAVYAINYHLGSVLSINLISNFLLLVICVIVLILPGVYLIMSKRKSK
ncbi:MAG: hypothetical protein Lokiarch_07800 [Candidatus Lokiarchaeum sp. GC14_75]|nr:MAG: hypothetical protein Lokiarch_07800 [Candidatus Lokiarchaeum sp. GC14_75]